MTYRIVDGVRSIEADDGIVIFNPTSGQFVDLDVRGAELWQTMVEVAGDERSIERHLVATFSTDAGLAAEVVAGFFEELERLGVVAQVG